MLLFGGGCFSISFVLGLGLAGYTYIHNHLYRLFHEQNRDTAQKLGIATALMFTLPILAFYGGLWIFQNQQEPNNWAGACAILVTNGIVGWYCYSAYIEDQQEKDEKDDRMGPKTGIYKQRVD